MNILSTLETALLSLDHAARTAATAQLDAAAALDFLSFADALSTALADQSARTELRMLAALALKNHVKASPALWSAAPRDGVKRHVLEALAGPDARVAQAAAQLAAQAAAIDIPRRQWPDLIPALVAALAPGPERAEGTKKAALATMGYFCEAADPTDPAVAEIADGLFTALTQAASEQETLPAVRKAALDALGSALGFLRKNFAREGERHYLMQVVCENTVSLEPEVQMAAFGVLVRVAALYYVYLPLYMEKALYALTTRGMESVDPLLACMAVEFWLTVCEEEIERTARARDYGAQLLAQEAHSVEVYDFAKGALSAVVPALLLLLTRQNEDFEDDSWSPAAAAAACLQLFAQDVGDAVVEPVVGFAAQAMGLGEWRAREAGVMAFGLVLEGPMPETIAHVIGQGLGSVVGLALDPQPHVREAVLWCVGRMADVCVEAVAEPARMQLVMQCIVTGLGDHPRVVVNACWAVINLAEQLLLDVEERATCALLGYYPTLVPLLVTALGRGDNEANARSLAYEALLTLVAYAPTDCGESVTQVALEALARLEYTVELRALVRGAEDRANLTELQGLVIDLTTSVVRKAKLDAASVADSLMAVFLKLLEGGENADETYIAIGALATAIEGAFLKYMDALVPVLDNALRPEAPGCRSAIGLVADVVRALREAAAPYAEGLLNRLGDCLRSEGADAVRAPVIACFGDIALALGSGFVPYLQVVMAILLAAQKLVPENDTLEAFDRVFEVQEAVMDAYVGIVSGLRAQPEVLFPYVGEIAQFLSRIPEDINMANNDGVCGSAAGLIGDLAEMYGEQVSSAFGWANEFLRRVKSDEMFSENTRYTARWARKMLKH